MESENPSSSNPVSDTQKGQLALIDIINVVRDLTLALNRIYETVILTQVTRCLKTELPKNLKERLDFFQNKRKIIKEVPSDWTDTYFFPRFFRMFQSFVLSLKLIIPKI